MIKRAFILCSPEGYALIDNEKVTCRSEDGAKEFTVESDLFEPGGDPCFITIDDTLYTVPTDEYIPVAASQTSEPSCSQRLQSQYYPPATSERFGNQRWSLSATRQFIKLLRKYGADTEQNAFATKRERWRYIARQMATNGYKTDELQVENRLKSLHRAYRNSKLNGSTTKKSFVMQHFEKELHELFAKKRGKQPTLLIELLDERMVASRASEDINTQEGFEENYTQEQQSPLSPGEQAELDATVPSPETCQSLLSTVDEMESAIYSLSQKLDEDSFDREELLHEVRRLAAASGLIRRKLTDEAAHVKEK